MEISWVTVGAQVVNFLVLVWLLKRFLYGPVIAAMERREQRIADRMNEAQELAERARYESESYHERQRDLDEQRERLLTAAREEASELRKVLHDDLREEIENTRLEWREQVVRERREFLDDLRTKAVASFDKLARRALADLADTELEVQVARTLSRRLAEMEPGALERIAEACGASEEPVVVASAFELPPTARERVAEAVAGALGRELPLEYRRSPEVGCGIELVGGGHRLAWSIDGYLDSLEEEVAHALTELVGGEDAGAARRSEANGC